MLADVRLHGWLRMRVDPRAHLDSDPTLSGRDVLPDGASFAYTISLRLTLAYPELILVGPWSGWHLILTNVVEPIKGGRQFSPCDQTDDVLDEYPVRFAD